MTNEENIAKVQSLIDEFQKDMRKRVSALVIDVMEVDSKRMLDLFKEKASRK